MVTNLSCPKCNSLQKFIFLEMPTINDFGFIKKLVKYYIDKLIHWMRMQKFNLELDNDIKNITENQIKSKKPKIIEKGTFGEDGWSISIGEVEDGDT